MTERIAIYTPDLSTGGVGKMRLHLVREMVRRGLTVDLLLADTSSPLFAHVPDGVDVLSLPSTHPIYSLPGLVTYLRSARPTVLITDRLRLNIATHRARALARVPTRLYLSMHNPLTVKLDGLSAKKREKLSRQFLTWAPRNDRIVAVSQGVADDLIDGVGLSPSLVKVVTNPVITPDLARLAAEPVSHRFFEDSGVPVILSAGRMTEQKDFPTLLKAFAKVRETRTARLLILGKHGETYAALLALVKSLGIADDVDMPGFDANPYRYMTRADVYALSSRWEGFGNVMVEAMATGLPVVATDCPVGPREILQDGRLGPLVPMGDAAAMADALLQVLDTPRDREVIKAGVERYTVERSVDGYLDTFGLGS